MCGQVCRLLMLDEGYIKYEITWEKGPIPQGAGLADMLTCRSRLFSRNLIGHNLDLGVGFGNISIRSQALGEFIISGTQTGHLDPLESRHCTLVTEFDIEQNSLCCFGPVKASSESLTHAAVYAAKADIGAVIHVHHLGYWQKWKDKVPTTPENAAYGTPEMALAVADLFAHTSVAQIGFFVMGGHEEGLIAFGKTIQEAEQALIPYVSG
ncbi:MAG: class II aldolase/adducin family protein [Bacteroidota bacterium]